MIYGTLWSDIYDMEYIKDEKGVTITSYLSDEDEVTIPSTIDDLPVRKIEANTFSDKKMKYVYLPDQLEVIEHHAFSNCRNIQRVEFPQTLRSVGNYAFYNCWELRSLHLPARLRSIGFGAFMNCEKLTELIQDKEEGREISIGSILNGLSHQMHVVIRHLMEDGSSEDAMLTFTEYGSEVVTVVSICKRADDKPTGTGTQLRYCVGSQDIDYQKYEGMFHIIRLNESFDTTVTVAVERLMYPYGLTAQLREEYLVYLKDKALQAAGKFIREDQFEKLKFCQSSLYFAFRTYSLSSPVSGYSIFSKSIPLCPRQISIKQMTIPISMQL